MANQMNALPQVHSSKPSSAAPASGVKAKDQGSHDEFSAKLAQAKGQASDAGAKDAKTVNTAVVADSKAGIKDAVKTPVKEISKDGKKAATKEELLAAQAQAAALAANFKGQPVVVTEKPQGDGKEKDAAQDEAEKAIPGAATKTKLSPELNANLQAQLQVQSQLKGQPTAKAAVADASTPANSAENAAQIAAAAKLGVHAKQTDNLQQTPNQAMLAHDMAGLAALQEQYQFEVDGSSAGEKPATTSFGKDAKTPTKFNTNDFLSLRELSQAQGKPVSAKDAISNPADFPRFNQPQAASQFNSAELKNAMGADAKKSKVGALTAGMTQTHSGQVGNQNFAKVIDAPVTTGSQQKPILSHDAVNQITTQVNLMSLAKQDGEIKIRLRPDHLGEMHMSVKTQGQSVSIQITAHSGEAKKIIEESLNSLKDSLGAQNLTLSNIEVVTPTNSSSNGHDMNMQSDTNSSRQHNDSGFGGNSEQNSRQERLYEAEQNSANLNTVRNVNFGRPAAGSTQNLDLIAS